MVKKRLQCKRPRFDLWVRNTKSCLFVCFFKKEGRRRLDTYREERTM